jgi:hypothetical protein
MFVHCGYLAACTPRQDLLIYQLCCGQLPPFGLIHLERSQAQCGALSRLCTARLRLRVLPPVMELILQPLLQSLSQSEVLCGPSPVL